MLSGISITHPDRVISETGHITKGELAEYYAAAASLILPQIERHPLSLLRCPSGIDRQLFFHRNPGRGLGAHIRTFEFKTKARPTNTFTSRMKKDSWTSSRWEGLNFTRGERLWMQSIIPIE